MQINRTIIKFTETKKKKNVAFSPFSLVTDQPVDSTTPYIYNLLPLSIKQNRQKQNRKKKYLKFVWRAFISLLWFYSIYMSEQIFSIRIDMTEREGRTDFTIVWHSIVQRNEISFYSYVWLYLCHTQSKWILIV